MTMLGASRRRVMPVAGILASAVAVVAVAVSLTASPAAAQQAAAVPVPSDLGCAVRMMAMSSTADKMARDETKPAAEREEARVQAERTAQAVHYYIGRLGPAFMAGNQKANADREYAAVRAVSKDVFAQEISLCWQNAQRAEDDFYKAINR